MKYTKRDREQAILICAIAASNGHPISVTEVVSLLCGCRNREATDKRCTQLAVRAWSAADRAGVLQGRETRTPETMPPTYAEAECLLREGWSPS